MEKNFESINFDDIRPVNDEEVKNTIASLMEDEGFKRTVEPLLKPLSWDEFRSAMLACNTIHDFQYTIIYPFMKQLIKRTTSTLSGEGFEELRDGKARLFISNHRDIVLDAAFLNILFFDNHIDTSEIAIGDNLLIYPWITKLVRLNKSFIVKRKVAVREMIETSRHLSQYIYDTIARRNQSIWIAQREGRAKDSNDRTQTALLKMLSLYNATAPQDALQTLNIVPLSITYEFDPCDYLKAKEFQLKRDNPEYKKSPADDIENMRAGIIGHKGQVFFRFGNKINDRLTFSQTTNKAQILEEAARIIDNEIFKNYCFFPNNYVAYDLMEKTNRFSVKYTKEQKRAFENYLNQQIEKINIANKDIEFLRNKLIEMYGNTLKNHLNVTSSQQE